MTKEMICIVCPLGCDLTVSQTGPECNVEGNKCPRGKSYAIDEMTNPIRTLTTTVAVIGTGKRLPVRTDKALPKCRMADLMKALKKVRVSVPVKAGQVVMENVFDTGVNIISSRTLFEL